MTDERLDESKGDEGAAMNTDIEASGLVMLGVCSVKGPSCTAPVTAAPITVVVEVETKNQIPVCRACFKGQVADGNWRTPSVRR